MKKMMSCLFLAPLALFMLSHCGSSDGGDATPENQSPTVSNIYPSSETLIKGVKGTAITLSADASDSDGNITRVEFMIDGKVVGQAVAAPYKFDWKPTQSGHYTFSVMAYDDKGATNLRPTSIFTAVGFSCDDSNEVCVKNPKSFDNVVMAFFPYWKTTELSIASIPWDKLTHINYSFAIPEADGNINITDVQGNISTLVNAAHAKGVKVYLSIGGAGGSEGFITLSKNERTRALFVDRVKCYVQANCLDGIDIDWEHWTGGAAIIPAESNGLVALLKDLRAGLDANIEISTDVFASNWFGKHYADAIVNEVTYINTMLYDLRGSWSEEGPHSAYDEVISNGTTNYTIESWGLAYWTGYRQWPAAKTIVGMPFYGRDFNASGGSVDYKSIVTMVKNAGGDINGDKFNKIYYDGPATAAKKAAYARDHHYAGVMFWELAGDTQDEYSLLKAIDDELMD
ncbi:glycosyl hydrolase family 18 protein [Pseudochryseolinea flava]|uniref:chitinase n=1 Tax=Pseudochryseolinea flava TaxID=2059302 RepID=A0A364Y776_9BACT|nr:glycosyl hydrolase family 18 protein [Pseudochryseolinea flava]RAW02966.1 hypothetical protein DQQ10_02355 [Pseudochryseolinea flava]